MDGTTSVNACASRTAPQLAVRIPGPGEAPGGIDHESLSKLALCTKVPV